MSDIGPMGPLALVEWLPWMVDGVIAFTVLEGLCLTLHHRQTGTGVPPRDFLANMVSGLCLMAGLRVALEHGAHRCEQFGKLLGFQLRGYTGRVGQVGEQHRHIAALRRGHVAAAQRRIRLHRRHRPSPLTSCEGRGGPLT